MRTRTALLSVSDRTNLEVLAKGLAERGFELLTTSGSGAFLKTHGISSRSIEDYTGQAEIFGGRVKTLHPKIYAGILARRDVPGDLQMLEKDDILPIDVVAVNLYPFRDALQRDRAAAEGECSEEEMIELIDIGGPSMIRAAAKNHQAVLPLIDPKDYALGLEILAGKFGELEEEGLRRQLAAKIFALLSDDGIAVASFLSGERPLSMPRARQLSLEMSQAAEPSKNVMDRWTGVVLHSSSALRYGENPHQAASFFQGAGTSSAEDSTHSAVKPAWRITGGKALSYNNLLDVDAMARILETCGAETTTAVVVKHLNPCGAARGSSALDALQRAKRSDPRSHFGGIIGFTVPVSVEAAQEIREDFAEVVVAPAYEPGALDVLAKSKNLRVIEIDLQALAGRREVRSVLDGFLVQERDGKLSSFSEWQLATPGSPSKAQQTDLSMAWALCAHVKSNAIVIVKDGMLVGVGAGQMSRIDSVEVALLKARTHAHVLDGAVAASDAFFPFPDGVEVLAKAGVKAVVAPSGAKRDAEIVATAAEHGVLLFLSGDRHFRH